ncbi:Protein CBR-HST-2 [Caenorhabditis briggsae]|uniref:Protein CBR-HST-2 n=2 Tax=Caenorhabditis briggsae TaxID=6238 RepID=A8XQZ3_CAEBR|nr:Protein CBR-HST-2 [Caenorhabditis briggsae]CAP35068.2 Protein CBR-HST-2 [Caenorhabditis briggsae]
MRQQEIVHRVTETQRTPQTRQLPSSCAVLLRVHWFFFLFISQKMLWPKRKTTYLVAFSVIILLLFILRPKKIPNSVRPWPTSNNIVIYNRIPKTGSTTFTNAIAYDLYKENGFNVLHVNMTKNRQVMSLPDQYVFINNVTTWRERLPAFYHGHVAYIDFTRFGVANPIYINIIREPLERLLSHYYFLRYGDNFRVGLKRSRAGNNETFDECYSRGGKDCDMKQMWMQIPYFCGHYHFCTEVGSAEALKMAKQNALEKYLLVGTTDRMRDMIALLEVTVPHFFKGALGHFDQLDENRAHLRYTKKKIPPNEQTLSMIRRDEVYKMEREFYDFVRDLFDAVFKKATNGTSRAVDLTKMPLQYHFEKVKPA